MLLRSRTGIESCHHFPLLIFESNENLKDMKIDDQLFEQLEQIVRSDKPVFAGDTMCKDEVYKLRDLGLIIYENGGYVATQLGMMTCKCARLQDSLDKAYMIIKEMANMTERIHNAHSKEMSDLIKSLR